MNQIHLLFQHPKQLRHAIKDVLNEDNIRTGDLGGKATTAEYTAAIIKRLS